MAAPGLHFPAFDSNGNLTSNPLYNIETVYIRHFCRSGDQGGTNFWVSDLLPKQTTTQLTGIAASFSVQDEAKQEYPFLAHPLVATQAEITAFINQVFQNLFARNADAGGLSFWLAQINN